MDQIFPMRAVAGVQPTERLHLGNYFGAIKQSIEIQEIAPGNNFCFVADYHAQASTSHWEQIEERTRSLAINFISLGLQPGRTIIYRQSDVPEVMEVMWLLSLVTNSALLERGHKMKGGTIPTAAVYLYPLLMSADILGLRGTHVPVGEDQKQHHDRAREIATRFNRTVKRDFLPIPEGVYGDASRVPGTDAQDPKYGPANRPKMSKSLHNFIPVFSSEEDTEQYVNKIVTRPIKWGQPIDPVDDTVFALYQLMATPAETEALHDDLKRGGIGYEDSKKLLTQKINCFFSHARERKKEWEERPDEVEDVLREGAMVVRREILGTLEGMRSLCGLKSYRRFVRA